MQVTLILALLGCPIVTNGDIDDALDRDGDGFIGAVHGGDDCNDDDPRTYPGAPDPWYDGVLLDCNRTDDFDADADGLHVDDDCDDEDPDIAGPSDWYVDSDFDNAGAGSPVVACDPGPGWAPTNDDCDDANSNLHPLAEERCNGVDDDCDGFVDDDDPTVNPQDFIEAYEDRDGDGVGDGPASRACIPPEGWAAVDGDCDDDDPNNTPGVDERCDGVDNDCDGLVDDDDVNLDPSEATWYVDDDGDGYGEDATADPFLRCLPNVGEVNVGGDCNDDDPTLSPGAKELCDGIDNDCDGVLDESDPDVVLPIWYLDVDGDGVGDSAFPAASCLAPDGYVPRGEDCDDDDPDLGAPVAVLVDQDEDGFGADVLEETCEPDADAVLVGGDCNDDDPDIRPGAVDTPYDGVDTDCNGASDYDADLDGQDAVAYGGLDCDDADPDTYDGAPEIWYDDVDQDCRGGSDHDADGDGYDAVASGGTDCDDTDPLTWPDAPEIWGDGIDQDCGLFDDLDVDMDGLPDMDGCTSVARIEVPGDEATLADAVAAAADCTEIVLAAGDHDAVALPTGSRRLLIRSFEDARIVGNSTDFLFRTNRFLGLAGLELEGGSGMIEAGEARVVMSDLYVHDSADDEQLVLFDEDALADFWLRYSTFERTAGIVEADAGHVDAAGIVARDLDVDFYVFYTYGTDVTLSDILLEDSDGSTFLVTTDATVDVRDIHIVGNRIDPFYIDGATGIVERVTIENNALPGLENNLEGASAGALQVRDLVWRNNIADLSPSAFLGYPRVLFVRNADVVGMEMIGNTFLEPGTSLRAVDWSTNATGSNLVFLGNLLTLGTTTGQLSYCWTTVPLSHVTMAANDSDGVSADGSCRLDHAVIAFNSGFGVANAPSVRFSDVYGNDGGDFVAMVNPVGVDGNVAVDPGLQTVHRGLPPAYMDPHLRPDSVLRDAGDPGLLDVDGSVADVGAYGGPLGENDLIDDDLDGLPDAWELRFGLDPTIDDALEDPDGDGLDNLGEFLAGTLPGVSDTDADQVLDRFDDFPLDADDA